MAGMSADPHYVYGQGQSSRSSYPILLGMVNVEVIGYKERKMLSILNKQKLERVLGYLLDENEFLAPHGVRSLSRVHAERPFFVENTHHVAPLRSGQLVPSWR